MDAWGCTGARGSYGIVEWKGALHLAVKNVKPMVSSVLRD